MVIPEQIEENMFIRNAGSEPIGIKAANFDKIIHNGAPGAWGIDKDTAQAAYSPLFQNEIEG